MSSVRHCARCGGDHENVGFKPLTKPIPGNDESVLWTHWAPCPTNGEPILQATVPTGLAQRYRTTATITLGRDETVEEMVARGLASGEIVRED